MAQLPKFAGPEDEASGPLHALLCDSSGEVEVVPVKVDFGPYAVVYDRAHRCFVYIVHDSGRTLRVPEVFLGSAADLEVLRSRVRSDAIARAGVPRRPAGPDQPALAGVSPPSVAAGGAGAPMPPAAPAATPADLHPPRPVEPSRRATDRMAEFTSLQASSSRARHIYQQSPGRCCCARSL